MSDRKEQIQAAALRCLARYGFHKTTMDDIAAAVGMKKASLYYYYKNKEAIFTDAMEQEIQRFIEIAEENLARIDTAAEKLFYLVGAHLEHFRERISSLDLSAPVMLEVQPIAEKIFRDHRQRDVDIVARIIREGVKSGEFRKCSAPKTADAIRAMVDALKLRELKSAEGISGAHIDHAKLEKDVMYILDLLVYGIKDQDTTRTKSK